MKKIQVVLTGTPFVKLGGELVHFRYKKAEALFYYLAVKKVLTRDAILRVFWAEQDEKSARDRLRDVLFSIKKVLGEETIVTAGNSVVQLGTELLIDIDVDSITENNVDSTYRGDFLDCFFIKNCYEFEEWCGEQRRHFRELSVRAFQKRIRSHMGPLSAEALMRYADLIMRDDPYNEVSLRELMELYAAAGQHNEAVQLYNRFREQLGRDLNERPEAVTQKLCTHIQELRKQPAAPRGAADHFFFGRDQEILRVTAWLDDLRRNKKNSVLLLGEAGVGKTALLDELSRRTGNGDFIFLKRSCYKAERDLHLKPWYDILTQLQAHMEQHPDDSAAHKQVMEMLFPCLGETGKNSLNLDGAWLGMTTEAVFSALARSSLEQKIVLMIDDIQWMDGASKRLLCNVLQKPERCRIGLLAACRDDCEQSMADLILPLESADLLTEIRVSRFNIVETTAILHEIAPNLDANSDAIRRIYEDTEGNALFLTELLKLMREKGYTNQLSMKTENVIRGRLVDLSEGESKLLYALSMFFDRVTLEELGVCVPDATEMEMCECLDALLARHLIKEETCGQDIFYSFSHQKIRDYVHKSQSAGKRRLMHKRIAQYDEDRYTKLPDFNLIPKLIYHFSQAADRYKTYVYKVEYLVEFYSIYHETYPYISHEFERISFLADEMADGELPKLAEDIRAFAQETNGVFCLKMKTEFILGRYHIRQGNYEEGLACIASSIHYAELLDDVIWRLNSYKQLVYYGIQVQNLRMIEENINCALEAMQRLPEDHAERSTLMRLKGLWLLKARRYGEAEEVICETIAFLNRYCRQLPSYQTSLAVCYNYIGECRYAKKDYENAFTYFSRAVDACTEHSAVSGIGVFYCFAGQALYMLERYHEARDYIANANRCLDRFHALWGKPRAEAYAALLELKIGSAAEARRHYNLAREAARQLANPEDIALVKQVGEQLAARG